MSDSPKGLTLEETADFTGYCYQTVWRWVTSGRIPAARVGTDWRVPYRVAEAIRAGHPIPTDGAGKP